MTDWSRRASIPPILKLWSDPMTDDKLRADETPTRRQRVFEAVAVHVGTMRADAVTDDVLAALAASAPDEGRLRAALDGIPELHLSGAQIEQAAHSDVIPAGYDPGAFAVDWDEYEVFVRLSEVRQRLAASATDEGPRDDLRTRALKRIVMARDGRVKGLRVKRFSAAREADLLAYAASVPDEDILGWRDTGPATLRWIRTHQPDEGEKPVRMIPDAVVGSTFSEVIKRTGWRIELFWNGSGGWFTARLISPWNKDGVAIYPGGYLAPFDDPIGASGATPEEAIANLSEAVLEWA